MTSPSRALPARALGTLTAALLTLASGCIVVVEDYNPFGTDVSVSATWDIGGFAPDSEVCATAGISTVEIRLSGSPTFGESFTDSALSALCAQGSLSTGAILAAGTHYVQVVGLDADGGEVQVGSPTLFTVVGGGEIVINHSFDDGSFDPTIGGDTTTTAAWTVNGKTPVEADCYDADIRKVGLAIINEAGDEYVTFTWDCVDGGFSTADGPLLASGTFYFQFYAQNYAGEIIEDTVTEAQLLDTASTDAVDFGTIAFVNAAQAFNPTRGGDTLTSADWTINGSAPSSDSCTAVGFTSVTLRIWDEAQTEYVDFNYPCTQGSVFVGPVLRSASFYYQWLAKDADGLDIEGSATTPVLFDFSTTGEYEFPTVDFVVEIPLSIELTFETGLDTNTFVTCAEITELESYTFQLYDSVGGTVTGGGGTLSCGETGDTLEFEGLSAGDYDLDVFATGTGGTKYGLEALGDCGGYTEPSLGFVYECQVQVIP